MQVLIDSAVNIVVLAVIHTSLHQPISDLFRTQKWLDDIPGNRFTSFLSGWIMTEPLWLIFLRTLIKLSKRCSKYSVKTLRHSPHSTFWPPQSYSRMHQLHLAWSFLGVEAKVNICVLTNHSVITESCLHRKSAYCRMNCSFWYVIDTLYSSPYCSWWCSSINVVLLV